MRMHRDRVEPGLRALSVAVEKSAASLSLSARTTLPVCHELPALPVVAEKSRSSPAGERRSGLKMVRGRPLTS
jgi:hypothetical protein